MDTLHPHQVEALKALPERAIYGDGAGTGKTATSLRWAGDYTFKRVLVLASSEEILNHWMSEGERWTQYAMILGSGTKAQRTKARTLAWHSESPYVLVLNYEAVWRDIEDLRDMGFDAIICDEAHHLKGRATATFKAVQKLARRSQGFLGVTGTPIMNRADEAWSLLNLCSPNKYPAYWRWVNEHFDVEITDFHGTIPKPVQLVKGLKDGHEGIVRMELAEFMVQRSYDDIFPDTPPARVVTIPVQLSDAERENYNELVRRSWTKVGDELIVTENAVAKTTRLRQLSSSWATISAESEHPGAKIEAAVAADMALCAKYDYPQVLILSAYQETARRVAQEIGEDAVAYHGSMSKAERKAILRDFKDGVLRVLSATIGTLGEGVDGLQVAHYMIQLDRDWTPARNEQIIARLRRAGKKTPVTVVYIEAENTIDQAVARALESKQAIINSLL